MPSVVGSCFLEDSSLYIYYLRERIEDELTRVEPLTTYPIPLSLPSHHTFIPARPRQCFLSHNSKGKPKTQTRHTGSTARP